MAIQARRMCNHPTHALGLVVLGADPQPRKQLAVEHALRPRRYDAVQQLPLQGALSDVQAARAAEAAARAAAALLAARRLALLAALCRGRNKSMNDVNKTYAIGHRSQHGMLPSMQANTNLLAMIGLEEYQ